MRGTWRPFGRAFLVISFVVLAGAPLEAAGWKLARSEEGVRVFTRPEPGSPYHAFRASVTIRAPFETLLAVMADTQGNCRWMHGCERTEVLSLVSFRERYVYQVNQSPPPLWPRDMIMHTRANINERGDEVTIRLAATPGFCDGSRVAACRGRDSKQSSRNFVRIGRAEGFYRLRRVDGERSEVIWQMHVEPGGDVSGWMANLALADMPLKSLSGLRRRVEEQGRLGAGLTSRQLLAAAAAD